MLVGLQVAGAHDGGHFCCIVVGKSVHGPLAALLFGHSVAVHHIARIADVLVMVAHLVQALSVPCATEENFKMGKLLYYCLIKNLELIAFGKEPFDSSREGVVEVVSGAE